MNVTSTSRSPDESLVVAGDDAGYVRFFRCPCPQKAQALTCAHSHVGPVGAVAFTCDGRHLVSVGKQDRAICLWRVSSAEVGSAAIVAVDSSKKSSSEVVAKKPPATSSS